MEEDKKLTLDEIRQRAIEKFGDIIDEYSLNDDTEGKQVAGIAQFYKELVADENGRKGNILGIIGQVVVGAGSVAIAIANLWMFGRATAKEESGEIFDTQTNKTVANSGLMGRFFRR